MGRLLHHVAKLAGDGEFAFAVYDRDFSAQDGAADFCPGETGDETDLTLFIGQRVTEFGDTEEFIDFIASQSRSKCGVFYNAPSYLTGYITNFSFQVTDTRLTRVGLDDLAQSIVSKIQLLFRKTVGLT